MLPSLVCGPELEQGQVVRVLEDWKGDDTLLHAVYPKSAWLTAAVRAFLSFLEEGL
jgi:DNA-binding transcriptional LysR family regulator